MSPSPGRNPENEAARAETAPIEGQVAFAMAAFALAIGLVALADVIGAPAQIVELLVPLVTLAGLATIGLMAQTMRMSRFYAGQRAVPAQYTGLAAAALCSALLLPFLPPVARIAGAQGFAQTGSMTVLAGFAAGFAIAALASGPLLRKTGAYSIADMLAGRFASPRLRQIAALVCALTALLVAMAGLQGATDVLARIIGLPREIALLTAGFVVLAIIAPGGAGGLTWSAAAAGGALLAGFLGPFIAALASDSSAPLPWLNDELWNAAANRIGQWQSASQSANFTLNEAAATQIIIALAAALGTASLAPLLAPAITTTGAAKARRAGWGALFFLALIVLGAVAALAISTLDLDPWLVGRRPQALPPAFYQASGHDLLLVCARAAANPGAALEACRAAGITGVLSARDIWASGLFLLSAAPEFRGLSVALSGLLAAGLAAVSLALTAAGAHAFATAIAHDFLFAGTSSPALSSRRLAATRLCAIGLVIVLAVWSARQALDPRALIALAIAISAASLAPLMALTLWPRATPADAMRAMGAGLAVFIALALLSLWDGAHAYGLSVASLAGFCAAIAAGLALSFRRTTEETHEGRSFLAGVLHGEMDLLNRERGA